MQGIVARLTLRYLRAKSQFQEQFEMANRLSQVDPTLAKVMVISGDRQDDKVSVKRYSGPAASLKPSQTTMVLEKSLGMALAMLKSGHIGGDLGALISSDKYIMDGHHRWSAAILAGGSSATVGGFLAQEPGHILLRILNILTKGLFKVISGKPGKGNLAAYTPSNVEAVLRSLVIKGLQGEHPWSPEEVKTVLVANFGSVEVGIATISKNADLVSKAVPSWAPARHEMPVIEPEQVPMAARKLQRGEVNWMPPYKMS